MPDVPSPKKVARLVDDLRDLALEVIDEYKWAHGIAFGGGSGAEIKVATSNTNDPTGNDGVTGSRRTLVRMAAKEIEQARKALQKARGMLGGVSVDRGTSQLVGVWPKLASDEDVAKAKEAKDRRERRGQGWGEG